MDVTTQVQNPDEAVCVSFHSNALGKGVDPSLLTPAMSKSLDRMGSLVLVLVQLESKRRKTIN